jgi:putative spermidine/putrescine transport system permease protein
MTGPMTAPDRGATRRLVPRTSQRWNYLGAVPLVGFVGLFLLLPTGIVAVGAFAGHDSLTWSNIGILAQSQVQRTFVHSLVVSAASSAIGAPVGALLAYAVATTGQNSLVRRIVTSACGVLALFGGVSLAFAFIATLGSQGQVTAWMNGIGLTRGTDGLWLYSLNGLTLVYLYFQIPLMVLSFLPALDGIQRQWREAAASLGCTTWQYWRRVGFPLLRPAFLGATLLLFANAFSAYATVAALITQGTTVVPLAISNDLSSEVGGGPPHAANALALAMVVCVALVMAGYALLQRRAARWLA